MKSALVLGVICFTGLAFGSGPADKDKIRKVIADNLTKVKECYTQRVKDGLKSEGKLTITWDIDDTGSGKNFREKNNELKDQKLFECVSNEIKSWRFPSPPKGETATVNYPFIFISKVD
jgi:hypothetical protein